MGTYEARFQEKLQKQGSMFSEDQEAADTPEGGGF